MAKGLEVGGHDGQLSCHLFSFAFLDPRKNSWFLVHSSLLVTILFVFCPLLVVTGPCFMAQKEPLRLVGPLTAYNLGTVVFSGYIFYEFMATSLLADYSYFCQPVDYSRNELAMRCQSVATTVHSTYNIFTKCPFPDGFNIAVLLYTFSFITLFLNFYNQTYLRGKWEKLTLSAGLKD